MAENSSVKKTSKRASINFPVGSEEEVTYKYTYKKSKKRKAKKAKKAMKKAGVKSLLIALLVLAIGVGAGIGAFYLFCRNDEFVVLGAEELTITLDEKYTDEGVKIVAFGKDIKNKVMVKTDLKVDENGDYYAENVGTYYIKYTTNELKYGSIFKIQKIRLITVVEPSETEETNSANATEVDGNSSDTTIETNGESESTNTTQSNLIAEGDGKTTSYTDTQDGGDVLEGLLNNKESESTQEDLPSEEEGGEVGLLSSYNNDGVQNFKEISETQGNKLNYFVDFKNTKTESVNFECENTQDLIINRTTAFATGGMF